MYPALLWEIQSALAKSESWSVSSNKRAIDALVVAGISNFAIPDKKYNLSEAGLLIANTSLVLYTCARHHSKLFLDIRI